MYLENIKSLYNLDMKFTKKNKKMKGGNIPKKYKIYCFWTGSNDMTPNRKRSLEQFKSVCEANVILITGDNIKDYIRSETPLHPAYEFLSDTQKSDYLRCYFMHFLGGGYSDIKETTGSWKKCFDDLEATDKWGCGYKEVDASGVAFDPGNEELIGKWELLIGCGAYIFKPQTDLTQKWYDGIIALMDKNAEALQKTPAKNPQNSKVTGSGYPIEWNEFNRIFHKVIYEYHDKILQTLPVSIFTNYRGGKYKRKSKKIFRGGSSIVYPPDSIKKYVSNIVYINLDKRTGRKAEIEKELKVFDHKQIHRISAVSEPEHPYLGCTKSHLQALKMAKDHNWDNVLILEDDAKWTNIEKGYPIFEKLIKEPFDVIMLGGTTAEYDHTTYKVKKSQAGSSYLVNKSYYDTIIQKTEEVINNFKPGITTNEEITPDVAVFRPLQAKDNWYIVAPSLMVQRPSHSDIEKKHVDYKNIFA
jgi:glycerol-3-phosphate cytidylyltransferase-like family protein